MSTITEQVIRLMADAKLDWEKFQSEYDSRESKRRDFDDMPDDPEQYRNSLAEEMP